MDAGLSVAEIQVDQDDFYLDLDADPGVEDFDFKLDSAYDNEEDPTTETAEDQVNMTSGLEITYEEEEFSAQPARSEHAETDEPNQETGEDVGMEYQDEIGYEDEEVQETAEAETGEAASLHVDPSVGLAEEYSEPQDTLGDDTLIPEADSDGADDQDLESEEHNSDAMFHGDTDVLEEDMSDGDGDAGLSFESTDAEGAHQQSLPDDGHSSASELENTEVGASDLAADTPNVTVHYDEGRYTLFGSPTDDPDSYFLSDIKELDSPLTQFLSSLRDVIAEDLSAEDGLIVRASGLDFEFGERSSDRFLRRTVREVLDCLTVLTTKRALATGLDLELIVQRDCEAHFLELLEDAKAVHGTSDHMELSEHTGDLHDQLDQPGYLEEAETDGGDFVVSTSHSAGESGIEDENQLEHQVESRSSSGPAQGGASLQVEASESAELAQVEQTGEESYGQESYEQGFGDVNFGENDETADAEVEFADGGVDISGELDEALTAGQISEDLQLSVDLPQPDVPQDVDQLGDEVEEGSHNDDGTTVSTDIAVSAVPGTTSLGNTPGFFCINPHDSTDTLPIPSRFFPGGDDNEYIIDIMDDGSDVELEAVTPQSGTKRKLEPCSPRPSPKRARLDVNQTESPGPQTGPAPSVTNVPEGMAERDRDSGTDDASVSSKSSRRSFTLVTDQSLAPETISCSPTPCNREKPGRVPPHFQGAVLETDKPRESDGY